MIGYDAQQLLNNGSRVKRAGWADFLILGPGDTIPQEDIEELDWIEVSFQEWEEIQAAATQHEPVSQQPLPVADTKTATEQVAQPQPNYTRISNMNVKVAVKRTKPLDISGWFAGKDAELVLVKSITCSDPSSALPLNGDIPAIIGIKVAENLTVTVQGVVKSPAGEAYEVEAVSNLFDVIPAEVEMMPVLDENGQPKQALNPDGTPMLDEAGNPMIELTPATAALSVTVQE